MSKKLPNPVARMTKDTSGNLWLWKLDQSPYLDTAVSCHDIYTYTQLKEILAEHAAELEVLVGYVSEKSKTIDSLEAKCRQYREDIETAAHYMRRISQEEESEFLESWLERNRRDL